MVRQMNPLRKLIAALRPGPPTPEELEARAEAQQIRDQMETIRVSQRSGAGENYQSGRGQRQ